MPTLIKLSPKQRKFVEMYLSNGRNAMRAYQGAYNSEASDKNAAREAGRVLKHPLVAAELAKAEAKAEKITQKVVEQFEITTEWIMQRWAAIARADPAELSQYRISACTVCWPDQEPSLSEAPNPECRGCAGEGVGRVFIPDTRTLSPSAKLLYAGVQKSREGIRALGRDQDVALSNLAKAMGMFKEQVELTGANGGAIKITAIDAVEAAKEYARIMGNG